MGFLIFGLHLTLRGETEAASDKAAKTAVKVREDYETCGRPRQRRIGCLFFVKRPGASISKLWESAPGFNLWCGCSSMAERRVANARTTDRYRSPAPISDRTTNREYCAGRGAGWMRRPHSTGSAVATSGYSGRSFSVRHTAPWGDLVSPSGGENRSALT